MHQKLYKVRSFFCSSMISMLMLLLASTSAQSQIFCNDENVFWFENFGTGITPVSHPDVIPGALTFSPSGVLTNEGTYRVINNSQQMPEWHFTADHTPGDVDGRMMVINGQSETFFRHVTTFNNGFQPGPYAASLYIINLNTPGTCAPNPLLPNITFSVEYLDQNNNWQSLQNSPVTSNNVPQTANPTWVVVGGVFTLPSTGAFIVTQMRVTLANLTTGGCGNDYAIDDIKLASCPSGGPVPVVFSSVTASLKGAGVLVNWSTSSELNNDRYEVEKSGDGGRTWSVFATVKGRGNSSTTVSYQAYDARPVIGRNLYRIRQIDTDGASKYSVTVSAQVKAGSTSISLLQNPVGASVSLDFLSEKTQSLRVRVNDISGKQLLSQMVGIQTGANRKSFALPASMSQGIYLLQILDEKGQMIFREKILKQ